MTTSKEHSDVEQQIERDPLIRTLEQTLNTLREEIWRNDWTIMQRGGHRYRTFPSAQRLVRQVWNLQQRLRIPVHQLPILSIPAEDIPEEDVHSGYDHERNVIYIPEHAWTDSGKDRFQLGDKLGEELVGHCYRFHHLHRNGARPQGPFPLGGKAERGDVEEYFGFLGRKFLHRMLKERNGVDVLFPKGVVTPPKDSAEVERKIEEIGEQLKGLFVPDRKGLQRELASRQGHGIGYRAGDAFQHEDIPWSDVDAMYGLPSEEVAEKYLTR